MSMQNQNQAPLPQRIPSIPEGLSVETAPPTVPFEPEFTRMQGWFREVTLTGERLPLKESAEVTQKWGVPFGTEVGKVILPGRDKPTDLHTKEAIEDQSLRTLHVFDARTNKHAPPHFIVASQSALRRLKATPPILRGAVARLSRDIHHIYEGERLEVGAKDGRWLPSLLKRREKKLQSTAPGQHNSRQVISGEQTMFYVGEDQELHVRSEGYNPDVVIAHPNAAEKHQKAKEASYEREMDEKIAKSRKTREQHIGLTATQHLRTHEPTTYVSRHGATKEFV